jgi:hypothetical protein
VKRRLTGVEAKELAVLVFDELLGGDVVLARIYRFCCVSTFLGAVVMLEGVATHPRRNEQQLHYVRTPFGRFCFIQSQ